MTVKKRVVTLAVLALTIVAILVFLALNPEVLNTIAGLSLLDLAPLLALQFLVLAANGLVLKLFSAKFGIRLKLLDWLGLSVLTSLGNYFSPFSGGMIARANYLKFRYGFPYMHSAAMLAAGYLVTYWVAGIVGALLMMTRAGSNDCSPLVLLFFLIVVIGITFVVLVPVIHVAGQHRVARLVASALEGWRMLRSDKPLLTKVAALSLVNVLLIGATYWYAFAVVGAELPFALGMLIGLLTLFSRIINVTPGNFGIQEATTSLAAGLLGVGADAGLVVALLIRAVAMLLVFALGPLSSYLLTHRLISARQRKRKQIDHEGPVSTNSLLDEDN